MIRPGFACSGVLSGCLSYLGVLSLDFVFDFRFAIVLVRECRE
jgi:hypothetical protein